MAPNLCTSNVHIQICVCLCISCARTYLQIVCACNCFQLFCASVCFYIYQSLQIHLQDLHNSMCVYVAAVVLMHRSTCTLISAAAAAHCLVCAALYPWPSMLCDPAYSLICLHQGTTEVTTHQSAVCFWRISTRDIWRVEGHSQVLCHVSGFGLTGHVVPCQAFLCVDLGLAHVIVSPDRRVMLHSVAHTGAQSLQSEQHRQEHRWSHSVWFL